MMDDFLFFSDYDDFCVGFYLIDLFIELGLEN